MNPSTPPRSEFEARTAPGAARRGRLSYAAALAALLALGACDGAGSLVEPESPTRTLSGTATLAWVSPTGTVATNPVTFKADATSDIVTIKYFADGTYLLGSSTYFDPDTVRYHETYTVP